MGVIISRSNVILKQIQRQVVFEGIDFGEHSFQIAAFVLFHVDDDFKVDHDFIEYNLVCLINIVDYVDFGNCPVYQVKNKAKNDCYLNGINCYLFEVVPADYLFVDHSHYLNVVRNLQGLTFFVELLFVTFAE
jgi:hypothetical protein